LRERPMFQTRMAEAVARVRSARAWLYASVSQSWESLRDQEQVSLAERADLLLPGRPRRHRQGRTVDGPRSLPRVPAPGANSTRDSLPSDRVNPAQHFRPSTFRSFVCLIPPTERPWPGEVGLTRPAPGTRQQAQRAPPEPSRKRTAQRTSRGRATPPYPATAALPERRRIEEAKKLGP